MVGSNGFIWACIAATWIVPDNVRAVISSVQDVIAVALVIAAAVWSVAATAQDYYYFLLKRVQTLEST